jgi:hypothetical protein
MPRWGLINCELTGFWGDADSSVWAAGVLPWDRIAVIADRSLRRVRATSEEDTVLRRIMAFSWGRVRPE